jgi:hypothetical protein
MPRMAKFARHALLTTAIVAGAVIVAGPTVVAAQTDPTNDTAPPDTDPPNTAPPDTGSPDTAPPDTATSDTGSSDDGTDAPADANTSDEDGPFDDLDPLLVAAVVIAGALVIAVIAGLWGAGRRRSRHSAAFRARVAEARSRARWLHDSLAVELSNHAFDSQPRMLQQAWADGQRHLNDLTAELHALVAQTSGRRHRSAVQALLAAVEALSGALATDVSLRSTGPTDDQAQLLQRSESTRTVAVRRAELESAIAKTESLAA